MEVKEREFIAHWDEKGQKPYLVPLSIDFALKIYKMNVHKVRFVYTVIIAS